MQKFVSIRLAAVLVPVQRLEEEKSLVGLGKGKGVGDKKGGRKIQVPGDAVQCFQIGRMSLFNFVESGSGYADHAGEAVDGKTFGCSDMSEIG